MTEFDLDELDRLHAAATPGPWLVSGIELSAPGSPEPTREQLEANSVFIAALVSAYPSLSAELRQSRARVEELEALLDASRKEAEEMRRCIALQDGAFL
jgi:hypothetical protein